MGAFDAKRMARFRNGDRAGAGYHFGKPVGHCTGNQPVILGFHHQGRTPDPLQAMFQGEVVTRRPDQLGEGGSFIMGLADLVKIIRIRRYRLQRRLVVEQ